MKGLLLVCGVCSACSPGRIAADGETGSRGESGTGLGASESMDGPIVETDSEGEADDGDGDWGGPGPCNGDQEGSLKWLDVCIPGDPCDTTVCDADQECLAGLCVAPKPTAPCEGIVLVDYELPVALSHEQEPLLLADLDGAAGDELISAGQGVVEVIRAGELLVSASLPDGYVNTLLPLQLDGDGHTDLLVHSNRYQDDFTALLSGDGEGRFEPALAQLPFGLSAVSPFPLDFDNDGDHDIVAWADGSTNVYANDAGGLAWLTEFPFDGRLGVATDLDLDGFIDDALLGEYPSPIALIGDGGQLLETGSLPEPPRGPNLQYGVGRPMIADLDGDGWVEVVSLLSDGLYRVGAQIWWGLPGNAFAEPRDQLLVDFGAVTYEDAGLIGFVELDGAPPLELLMHTQSGLGYARPDLANQLPFECFSPLLEVTQALTHPPAVGDLDGDGRAEIAIRDYLEAEVYSVVVP